MYGSDQMVGRTQLALSMGRIAKALPDRPAEGNICSTTPCCFFRWRDLEACAR
jgi:hypothetical protein